MRLLVRREPNGEMSNYLHRLPQGATIELRGPVVEYQLPTDIDELLFLAGGTGIAPALQAAYALLKPKPDDDGAKRPRMTILWANRKREDCAGAPRVTPTASWWASFWPNTLRAIPSQTADAEVDRSVLVEELASLQSEFQDRFSVRYFVDEDRQSITPATLDAYLKPQPTSKDAGLKKLVLVSGPDGFVSHFAGPKVWRRGEETQGRLAGVLGTANAQGWDVWKL